MIALPSPGRSAMGVAEPVFKTCGSAYTILLLHRCPHATRSFFVSYATKLTGSNVYYANNCAGDEEDDDDKCLRHHCRFS
jgi:hypothetical protein